jgi:CelD/BcsL family acetyltransferase involved in cellulose biosynthesis
VDVVTSTAALRREGQGTRPGPDEGSEQDGVPRLNRLELEDLRWMRFVSACPSATPFHHPDWAAMLAETYGFGGFALTLEGPDGPVAGAPFLEVRGLSRRRHWISLPFTDECPVLASDPAAEQRFLGALASGAAELGAPPSLELRAAAAALGWESSAGAVIHELELSQDAEAVKRGFSKSQVVRNIKRADREGVTVREARSLADLDAFYALHLRTRRRQGVPIQPRRFFDLLWSRLLEQGLGSILLAEAGGEPLAGALFLSWNGTTIYKFGASDQESWKLRPNHPLFWRAMQEACARGDRRFDFGRTDLDNPGLRDFKSRWGAVERPLVYSSTISGATDGVVRRALSTTIQHGPEWLCRRLGEALYRYSA